MGGGTGGGTGGGIGSMEGRVGTGQKRDQSRYEMSSEWPTGQRRLMSRMISVSPGAAIAVARVALVRQTGLLESLDTKRARPAMMEMMTDGSEVWEAHGMIISSQMMRRSKGRSRLSSLMVIWSEAKSRWVFGMFTPYRLFRCVECTEWRGPRL